MSLEEKGLKIGIIGAMNEEVAAFLSGMEHSEEKEVAGITFHTGVFNGKDVIVCKSGVGKVNASVCTQVLISSFGVEKILFTGVAGALDPRLDICDIVISTECMHHDMDATSLGFKKGEIPYDETYIFKADQKLVDLAQKVSLEVLTDQNVFQGRVLSGDQFISNEEKVSELHKELHGTCTEMEGAAVAQVCHMNHIPYVVIRSMSDKANGSANVNFMEFTKKASHQSYSIIDGMLKNWV